MVRISKQAERRSQYPRKHKHPSPKTGPLKDKLANGFKEHANSLNGETGAALFISKIK
jgi:hypothetical protein